MATTHEPIEITDDALYARMHVSTLHNGRLPLPGNVSVVVEIGASDRNTMDVEFLQSAPQSFFLVSFEPVIDKYSRGLARHPTGGGDRWQALGHHHERGIILPFAIGPQAGMQTLSVASNSGCSSLLPFARNERTSYFRWCASVKERRRVPTITLHTALALIGRPVALIKLDAQVKRREDDRAVARANHHHCCSPRPAATHAPRSAARASIAPRRPLWRKCVCAGHGRCYRRLRKQLRGRSHRADRALRDGGSP